MAEEKRAKSEQAYESTTVYRTGQRPLTFEGILLAESTTREINGPRSNRWHNYELHRTRGGKYVLVHEYITLWQGEANFRDAWVSEDANEVFQRAVENNDGYFSDALVELAWKAGIDIAEKLE